ncbi:hypothetical protein [Kineococcus sp. SYSU DK001]|uniref:hypothetical protein n=1 Tax=Kineococcus sp. SYSU DK001 TaxID=3383122 RepID=UPI003D7D1D1C
MTSTTVSAAVQDAAAGTSTTGEPGRLDRLVVPVGVVCSVSHLVSAPVHGANHPVAGILTAAAAVFCLFHLGRLWRAPTVGGWWSTGALAALMTLHSPVLDALGGSAGTAPHRPGTGHHSASTPLRVLSLESLTTAGTVAGVVQTVLCLVVVLRLRRRPVPR